MPSRGKLLAQAAAKFTAGFALLAALLFLPAGTLRYPGAWRLLALLLAPMAALGAVLLVRAPALLEKRLRSREKAPAQRRVVAASALMFACAFLLAGLDFRLGLTRTPGWLTALASVLQLAAYGLYAEVLRENAFLSRTIEVQPGQTLVDTGLYGVIRHPMYAATLVLFLCMPLVLGSFLAFAAMLAYPPLIVLRIRGEERMLLAQLPGYRGYVQRVRWRLVPFLW